MQSREELRLIDAIQCCDRYQDALNQTCYNLKEHQEKSLENKKRKDAYMAQLRALASSNGIGVPS